MCFRVAIPNLMALAFSLFCAHTANTNSCQHGTFLSSISDTCLPPYPGEEIDAFERPMSFTMRQVSIRPETTWIAAEGIITKDTPDEFRSFWKTILCIERTVSSLTHPAKTCMPRWNLVASFGNLVTLPRLADQSP